MKKGTILLVCLLAAAPLSAQLPQASAAALGLGYNTTASARGFAAVASNPAGLSPAGSPGFSMAIGAAAVEADLGPITLVDLADYEGRHVPDAVRAEWMSRVEASGGIGGLVAVAGTPIALNMGPIGLQVSTRGGSSLSLNEDAVELLLYGNAGRTGQPRDLELDGSTAEAFALSTAAVSIGFPVSARLHLGVTGKYIVGHGLAVAREGSGRLNADPVSVELQFPFLMTDTDDYDFFDQGSGYGLDIGALWEGPGVTLGATVQNVVNTFEWKLDHLEFVPGQALFDRDSTTSDFDERPLSAAPASLLEAVEELTIQPVVSVGAELPLGSLLRLQADVRKTLSDGLELDPAFHAGVGAELTALSLLPLRAHVAAISGGVQVGGGASLVLGPVHLSAAAALRASDTRDAFLGMFTLSFGGS